MNGLSILVVGAGFLGRAIALRLSGTGHRITVLSPHARETPWPEGIDTMNGRQEDHALMNRLLADNDAVIHVAWGTTPNSSAGRPALEAERGLDPFLAFFETLQRFSEVRLLFLSSGGTVYGETGGQPVGEERPMQPLSCHGAGKAAAETFLGMRRTERTLILRPSNIYGPGQGMRSGFGVVPHLLRCAAEGRPFQMWGDGSQVRDYLYVDDFADAVSVLLARPEVSGTFNLGSGSGTSLNELVGLVEGVTGREVRIERHPPRPGDVARIVLNAGRLTRATGWLPVTRLAEGIGRAWLWLQQGDGLLARRGDV